VAVAGPGTNAESLLTLPEGSHLVAEDGSSVSLEGLSQGLAVEFWGGRVYASAEAMMFTALLDEFHIVELPFSQEYLQEVCDFVNYDEVACAVLELLLLQPTGETVFVPRGMHSVPDNEQYLLNVMHWLGGIL
jgi:hypothetical protein